MADEKKVKCIVNGRTITMTAAAFKVARRFYGAVSEQDLLKSKPVELQRPLIKPEMKPVIIKPPIKEIETKIPDGDPKEDHVNGTALGDPKTDEAPKEEPVNAGDPKTKEAPKAEKPKRTASKSKTVKK